MLCQPCDRPDASPITLYLSHPTRTRGTPHLAIPGSSLTRNAGASIRAIRGTRAIKAITAVKATTRARGKPQNPQNPANRPTSSRLKSGIVGSLRPGNHSYGSQRPGKHPTPLTFRSWRPGINPKPKHFLTCTLKPDGSGYALNFAKSSHRKLLGQQCSHSSCCSGSSSPPTTEPEDSIQDNAVH